MKPPQIINIYVNITVYKLYVVRWGPCKHYAINVFRHVDPESYSHNIYLSFVSLFRYIGMPNDAREGRGGDKVNEENGNSITRKK